MSAKKVLISSSNFTTTIALQLIGSPVALYKMDTSSLAKEGGYQRNCFRNLFVQVSDVVSFYLCWKVKTLIGSLTETRTPVAFKNKMIAFLATKSLEAVRVDCF